MTAVVAKCVIALLTILGLLVPLDSCEQQGDRYWNTRQERHQDSYYRGKHYDTNGGCPKGTRIKPGHWSNGHWVYGKCVKK